MRFSVMQEKLQKAVTIASLCVDNRPTLPVLGNLLLWTQDAVVMVGATNLETSIWVRLGSKIDKEGAITLPAETMKKLVANLSPERVDFDVKMDNCTANIKNGTTKASVKGIDAAEFPNIYRSEHDACTFRVPYKDLMRAMSQASVCVARETGRPILTGIHFVVDGGTLTVEAADGYRYTVSQVEIDNPSGWQGQAIIPPFTLLKVLQKMTDEDIMEIDIPADRDLWCFKGGTVEICVQTIVGKFPDVSAIIPTTYETAASMDRNDLEAALNRAEVFARDSAYSIKLVIEPPMTPGDPGSMNVIALSTERGESEGMMDIGVEGVPVTLNANLKYLKDIPFDSERVVLENGGKDKVLVFRPENEDGLYLVMPMQVQR